ncbi:MAG: hypothetical protein RL272_522 [Candidatus Parcubacteria bacterium]
MNVHPILVHFPIALLTVYAVLELLRVPHLMKRTSFFYVKAAFLLIGSAGSLAAYVSGNAIEDMFASSAAMNRLVHIHSRWAIATVLAFGALAFCYAAVWLKKELDARGAAFRIVSGAARLGASVLDTPLAALIALAGLACVTVTGALGGAIVYGADIDPIVKFITVLVA